MNIHILNFQKLQVKNQIIAKCDVCLRLENQTIHLS